MWYGVVMDGWRVLHGRSGRGTRTRRQWGTFGTSVTLTAKTDDFLGRTKAQLEGWTGWRLTVRR